MWVVLDCDGIVLDSNAMKCDAFAAATQGYPEQPRAAFLAHQRTAFGTSRYRLFDQFFTDFLGRLAEPGERDGLLARFADICRTQYPLQPLTTGARETIAAIAADGHVLAIASGSDEAELRAALRTIGLDGFFAGGIHGSPRAKADHLAALKAVADGQDMLFVGDAHADWKAADANAIRFVGMATWSADPDAMHALRDSHGFPLIDSLPELLALIPGRQAT